MRASTQGGYTTNYFSVKLAFQSCIPDNEIGTFARVPWSLNLAVVASRSSLIGALVRTAPALHLNPVLDFLTGLSCGELECLAEFAGACTLEAVNPYRMLPEFFDPAVSERWLDSEDRAHKTFIVLSWLEVQNVGHPAVVAVQAA